MKVFIVYCHPGRDSFTADVKDSFIAGLESAGHSYILSDLYAMNFSTDMGRDEYTREAFYRLELPLPEDVKAEHEKINASEAIAFIYPVFWSDAPAKLKGWFDRVWTFGFAYGENRRMRQLEKGLVLCVAGNTMEYFERTGIGDAMKKVMLDDRLFDRVKAKEMIIFDATSRELPKLSTSPQGEVVRARELNRARHLERAFKAGAGL